MCWQTVAELETDDAAYLLESIPEPARQEILAQMPTGDRPHWSAT
jgi:Mg/Co/Ni transporter MgtE